MYTSKNKFPKLTGNHAITVARYSLVPLYFVSFSLSGDNIFYLCVTLH